MDLPSIIKDKRPNLNEKSIKTYSSILKNLMRELNYQNVTDLNKTKQVLEHLQEMPVNKRKTRLSALVVFTGKDEYREQMLKDINKFNGDVKEQKKSKNEKEAWMQPESINKIYDRLKKRAMVLYKKENRTVKELQEIQDFVLLSLFTLIPPRRAMDYTEMKIKNIDTKKDNYIKNKNMIFNIYKTSKNKGVDIIEIPKQLKMILNKWIKINPNEYLLFDSNGNKLTSVKVNQRFNKIMDKPNFSVNMFRHIYLTDKYKDTMKEMKEMEKDMEDMGSSMKQAKTYVKLD